MSRAGAVLLGLCLAGMLIPAPAPAARAQSGVPQATFTWSMPPRFGVDGDGDGRVEIENTPEYTHNRSATSCLGRCPEPGFDVELRAHPTATQLGLPATFLTYEWRISGPTGDGTYPALGPDLDLRLPEGSHDIDLRVRVALPWGHVTQRARGTIDVDDLLVVALGDSYASGEGNPEVPIVDDAPALWADSSDPVQEERHAAAHRSTVGWPTQVAYALETSSPHSSVTFINLTSSGARIDRGVVGARSTPALPAQLDELADIAQQRPIDVVLLQIGGNDVGFSRVIRALVDADPQLDPICYEVMMDNAWNAVNDGVWNRDVRVTYSPPFDFGCESTGGGSPSIPGLAGLERAFDRLETRLAEFEIEQVVAVGYPDPTGSSAPGDRCQEIVGDVTPPFTFHEVDEQEQQDGVELLLEPLNGRIAAIASAKGWITVDGIPRLFDGHGYCAPWPDYGYPGWFTESPLLFGNRLDAIEGWYRVPGQYGTPVLLNDGPVSWYRTASQSAALQGPVPRYLTAGTLHPNEQGHLAIAWEVLAALAGSD